MIPVYAMALCLCLSDYPKLVLMEMAEQIEFIFGTESTPILSYILLELEVNLGICKIRVLRSGTVFQTIDLEKFHCGKKNLPRHTDSCKCCQLS